MAVREFLAEMSRLVIHWQRGLVKKQNNVATMNENILIINGLNPGVSIVCLV